MEKRQTILVPHDFTEVADYALQHAILVAENTGNDITMVHIIDNESKYDTALEKCNEIAGNTFKKHFRRPKVVVKTGSIFTAIGKAAKETNASLVIMGTHGIKGMQKLTGSWALKVIVHSEVPFIIVQEPPKSKKFKKIVFPIDFKVENKEKNQWVNYLAKHYQSKFFLIKQDIKDKAFKRRINSNMVFAKKYLTSRNVEFEIHTAPAKTKFWKGTLSHAKEINADLILIMATRDIGVADYAFGANEQNILANPEGIPVMCINPSASIRKEGGFSAMGG
ncbi:MAG: universal stress protein [Bacteroidetes bacterium]|nr:universal stress protein [Bacteroidota bacterium]